MRGRKTLIGISLLIAAGVAPAWSEDAFMRRNGVAATVDASGRVTPITNSTTFGPELLGASGLTGAPCHDSTALSTDAAKELVRKIAAEENFYPNFVLSVAKIESGYVSTNVSDKGAYGLMQLMPKTAQRFGVDLCNPADNIRGGVRYLRLLHDRFRNPFFMLAAYNAGEEAVEKTRGVPPYPETVRFVTEVVNDFYAWPLPSPELRTKTDLGAGQERDRNDQPGSLDAKTGRRDDWSAGFVMHVQK